MPNDKQMVDNFSSLVDKLEGKYVWVKIEHKPNPTPKPQEPRHSRKNRIDVWTFGKDGSVTRYHFHIKKGGLYSPRILDEAIETDQVMVMVKNNKGDYHYIRVGSGSWMHIPFNEVKRSMGEFKQYAQGLTPTIQDTGHITITHPICPRNITANRLAELEKRIERDRAECNQLHAEMRKAQAGTTAQEQRKDTPHA